MLVHHPPPSYARAVFCNIYIGLISKVVLMILRVCVCGETTLRVFASTKSPAASLAGTKMYACLVGVGLQQ